MSTTELGIFEEVRKLGPYQDPLGEGSLQPDPRTRRRDARSRILRNLRDQETALDAGLRALQALVERFPLLEHHGAYQLRTGIDVERQKALLTADRDLERLENSPDIPASRERITAWIEHLEARGRYSQAAKYVEHLDEL